MQTFLISPNYQETALALDYRRLGKSRVECLQILQTLLGNKKGWSNHPCVRMWRGHEYELGIYGMVICTEWIARGYKDTCRDKIWNLIKDIKITGKPSWMDNQEFYRSHKSNLIRNLPEHYYKFWPEVPNNLEYIWPV